MNKAVYENKITKDSYLAKIPESMEYFRVGRKTLLKIASECDGIVRIGGVININIPRVSAHIEKNYMGEA